jgi:TPR repeat protein
MTEEAAKAPNCQPLALSARAALFFALLVNSAATFALSGDALPRQGIALREQAEAYEHGEGVAKDPQKAAQLYCQAARKGDAEAQFSLGWMYANGRGIERDDAHAATLFSMAARQGHDYAKRMLQYVAGVAPRAPSCLTANSSTTFPRGPGLATRPEHKKIVELVNRVAPEYRIDPRLALAVIGVESNFNTNARSPKNAQGLMQLIPETSERFNVKDPYDPVQNLRGGLRYLRWLLAYYRGDVTLAAAGYNAGEGAVDRYRGVPPYPETRAYVEKIVGAFRETYHPYDPDAAGPSPELKRMKPASASPVPARERKSTTQPEIISDAGQPIRR